MNGDPLLGPKLKIKRAKGHIEDVATQIRSFYGTEPYPIAHWIEDEGDGGQQALKVRVTHPIPGEIATAVGDVVGNLRSALDLLTYSLAVQNRAAAGLAGEPPKTYFPIAGDLDEFQLPATQRKIKPLSQDAIDLIWSLKPYKGGNDLLWALNRVRNTDDHAKLVSLAAATFDARASMTMMPNRIGVLTFEAPRFCSFDENQTVVLLKFPKPAGNPHYELNITVDVAFGDIEVVKGQPVVTVLHHFSGITEGILLLFEKRFFSP